MRIPDEQVTTAEVRQWRGVHLLHFQGSSCSQKVRILLREKGIVWESHPVDLPRQEHTRPWFLGINPRGVVPVLVHDGAVHVESNDILAYLDAHVPSAAAPFFPQTDAERRAVQESLDLENSLHRDLRAVTMGFLAPRRVVTKSTDTLRGYAANGAPDAARDHEVAWWHAFARHGVTRDQTVQAFRAFGAAFERLDRRLGDDPWLLGDRISVLEIAWFISVHRLALAGYPLVRHPRLHAHHRRLRARPAFAREVQGGLAAAAFRAFSLYRRLTRTTLLDAVSAPAL